MFVDLDGLKHVNDTQGHTAGDALIVDAARVLTGVFRESDVIARLGGDEFAVLALVDDTAASVAISKHLQARIDEVNHQAGRPFRLSMSFGIEVLPSVADVSPRRPNCASRSCDACEAEGEPPSETLKRDVRRRPWERARPSTIHWAAPNSASE